MINAFVFEEIEWIFKTKALLNWLNCWVIIKFPMWLHFLFSSTVLFSKEKTFRSSIGYKWTSISLKKYVIQGKIYFVWCWKPKNEHTKRETNENLYWNRYIHYVFLFPARKKTTSFAFIEPKSLTHTLFISNVLINKKNYSDHFRW